MTAPLVIDLLFGDRPRVIAAFAVDGPGGVTLLETGPSSTLPALLDGLRTGGIDLERVTTILVTHIHLDHSGAAGRLLRHVPNATVRVHPIGAPHLVDPARLLASATRIYGDRMDALWGEVVPIPAERVVPLVDGERLRFGEGEVTAIFTPGHASHHVAYWDESGRTLYTGDAGGVRVPGTGYVCPPTPPPDLDPAAWASSIGRMRGLDPARLYLTHFGEVTDVEGHFDRLATGLDEILDLGSAAFEAGPDGGELVTAIRAMVRAGLANDGQTADVGDALATLEAASPSGMAAMGLERWARKRAGG
ncbi:MAG: MBL fold metallo-hydrolase [Chloroflexia bacterium]|nr:MBL fold metallo-hydrolase [Chloroflexia bacterium]MDQ3514894.1 MBL fold metallo-hydrolase [Chloroflexota bacterium]